MKTSPLETVKERRSYLEYAVLVRENVVAAFSDITMASSWVTQNKHNWGTQAMTIEKIVTG